MSKAVEAVSELCASFFKREEILPIDEWVEKHIRLTKRQSTHAGRYSLQRTPFFRQIYKDLADPYIRKVVLEKSAQVGASTVLGNVVLYYACNYTLPIAVIFPSQAMSQQFSERVLHPSLETTEPIKDILTGTSDDIRRSEFIFKTCTLKVIGGGSATKLSSNPVAILAVDEADKFSSIPGEADALELAEDRTLTYQETKESKVFVCSTPTVSHSSTIHSQFLEGDQNYYYVPCPHCNHSQRLVFGNVKWDETAKNKDGEWIMSRVEKSAHYECEHCKGAILDSQKPSILLKGEWKASNPNAPEDIKSYHISALYSLSLTFGNIARLFLHAKNDRSKLQNFHNSILGEAWTPTAATIDSATIDELIALSPEYYKGEIPSKAKALIAGIDTQQNELVYAVLALLENGNTALVDYGYVASFPDLSILLGSQYKVRGTEEYMGIHSAFQDAAGGRTSQVYESCMMNPMVVPVFGRTESHKLFAPIRISSVNYKGNSLPVVQVHDRHFSEHLLLQVFKYKTDRLLLPQDLEKYAKEQLTAVSLVEKRNKKGFVQHELVSKAQNHLFDAVKYAFALRFYLAPQLNTPEDHSPVTPPPEETPSSVEQIEESYADAW